MKLLLLLLFFSFFLVSCTQYHFLTVSGINVTKTPTDGLTTENDTLKIKYLFAEYGGKVGITVFNKTDQPIEIDWKKSAMIINGEAISYYDPNGVLTGAVDTNSSGRLASYRGNIQLNEPSQFIPPRSSIYKESFLLKNKPHNVEQINAAINASLRKGERATPYSSKRTFQQETTPAVLKSYLTIRIGNEGSKNEYVFEHKFFVSEVDKREVEIRDLSAEQQKRGDRFYFQP